VGRCNIPSSISSPSKITVCPVLMFSTLTVCKMCATEMIPSGPPFTCRICRKSFPRLRNLKRHRCQRAVPLMSLKLDALNLGRRPTSPARVSGARSHPPSPQQPPHPSSSQQPLHPPSSSQQPSHPQPLQQPSASTSHQPLPSSPSSTVSSSPGIQLSPGTPS